MKGFNGKKFILIILGPPGAGKGTQSKLIVEKYGLDLVVTGDLVRELRQKDTLLGRKVKENYDAGIPQPDEIIVNTIREKIPTLQSQVGILFDTFPLSVVQAEALEKMAEEFHWAAPYMLYIKISAKTVVKRISSRLVCSNPKCKEIHMPSDGQSYKSRKCKKCGSDLIQRPDDKSEAVMRRIEEYKERMKSLKKFYQQRGRLIIVNGEPSVPEVTKEIFEKIEKLLSK